VTDGAATCSLLSLARGGRICPLAGLATEKGSRAKNDLLAAPALASLIRPRGVPLACIPGPDPDEAMVSPDGLAGKVFHLVPVSTVVVTTGAGVLILACLHPARPVAKMPNSLRRADTLHFATSTRRWPIWPFHGPGSRSGSKNLVVTLVAE
jgi:hypothetical protein